MYPYSVMVLLHNVSNVASCHGSRIDIDRGNDSLVAGTDIKRSEGQ